MNLCLNYLEAFQDQYKIPYAIMFWFGDAMGGLTRMRVERNIERGEEELASARNSDVQSQ